MGQSVFSEKLTSENTKINVSNLNKGVYICYIINGDRVLKSEKLLIY